MAKEIYQAPEMDVTSFNETDIIVTSPGGEDWELPINGNETSY